MTLTKQVLVTVFISTVTGIVGYGAGARTVESKVVVHETRITHLEKVSDTHMTRLEFDDWEKLHKDWSTQVVTSLQADNARLAREISELRASVIEGNGTLQKILLNVSSP